MSPDDDAHAADTDLTALVHGHVPDVLDPADDALESPPDEVAAAVFVVRSPRYVGAEVGDEVRPGPEVNTAALVKAGILEPVDDHAGGAE